jgi:hypothetical protein
VGGDVVRFVRASLHWSSDDRGALAPSSREHSPVFGGQGRDVGDDLTVEGGGEC